MEAVILKRLRDAFDSASVSEKNIALRAAFDEIEWLRNEVKFLKERLDAAVAHIPSFVDG